MKRVLTIAVMYAAALVSGCASGPDISVDYSTAKDFSDYKTYRWYDDVVPSQQAEYRQHNSQDKRVRKYFGNELERLGFQPIESGQADFLINYNISTHDQMKVDEFSHYSSRGMHGSVATGTYGSAVTLGYSTGSKPRVYKEGTVVIDIIDGDTFKVVWRAIAEGRLPKDRSQQKKDEIAFNLSREFLSKFPPQE